MGLFGYNEKDFAKNADYIKTQLDNLSFEAGREIRDAFTATSNVLDTYPFPKSKGKNMEKIDDLIISKILPKMAFAIHDKKLYMAREYATWLLEVVRRNRAYGEVTFDDKILTQREKLLRLKGNLDEIDAKIKANELERDQIKQEARGLSRDSIDYRKLSEKFKQLEADKQLFDANRTDCQNAITNANIAIRALDRQAQVNDINTNVVVSAQEFAEINRDLEKAEHKMNDENEAFTDQATDFQQRLGAAARGSNTGNGDSLGDSLDAEEAAGITSSIQNSSVSNDYDPLANTLDQENAGGHKN